MCVCVRAAENAGKQTFPHCMAAAGGGGGLKDVRECSKRLELRTEDFERRSALM